MGHPRDHNNRVEHILLVQFSSIEWRKARFRHNGLKDKEADAKEQDERYESEILYEMIGGLHGHHFGLTGSVCVL